MAAFALGGGLIQAEQVRQAVGGRHVGRAVLELCNTALEAVALHMQAATDRVCAGAPCEAYGYELCLRSGASDWDAAELRVGAWPDGTLVSLDGLAPDVARLVFACAQAVIDASGCGSTATEVIAHHPWFCERQEQLQAWSGEFDAEHSGAGCEPDLAWLAPRISQDDLDYGLFDDAEAALAELQSYRARARRGFDRTDETVCGLRLDGPASLVAALWRLRGQGFGASGIGRVVRRAILWLRRCERRGTLQPDPDLAGENSDEEIGLAEARIFAFDEDDVEIVQETCNLFMQGGELGALRFGLAPESAPAVLGALARLAEGTALMGMMAAATARPEDANE